MSSEVRRAAQAKHIEEPVPIRKFRADPLLYAIVLFTWTAVWRVQDLFGVLAAVKFPLLIQAITLVVFLASQTPERRLQWIKSPILTITLILLVIMVVGLPSSLWPGKGFTFITRDFVPTILLMVILAASVRESSDLEWLAFAHLCGGMVYAAVIFANYDVGANGRLGELVYYDANDFAMIMVCTIPFAVFFLRPGVVVWKRAIALAALMLFVIMIIRSGSRGGFLGMIAIGTYILLRYKAVPTRLRIGAVVGGAALLMVVGSSSYWEMMSTLLNPKDDYNMTDETGRSKVWKRGIGYMMTHPVLGVGVRAFPQAEGMLSQISKEYAARGKGIKWSVAHNSFVEIGAELGLIALLLFVSMLWIAIRDLARVGKGPRGSPYETPDDSAFAQTIIASLVGYIVCGFFVSAEYFTYLYVLLALVIGQQAVFRRRARQHPPSQRTTRGTGGGTAKNIGTKKPLRIAPRPIRPQWLPTGS